MQNNQHQIAAGDLQVKGSAMLPILTIHLNFISSMLLMDQYRAQ
jgi:hypothetical protein